MRSLLATFGAVALGLTACSGPSQTADGGDAAVDAAQDGPKPNPCADKPNYVFDDASATPGGFGLDACKAFAAVEKMAQSDAANAAQFITPLAGQKLPASKPYKFTWSAAQFPSAPSPGSDSSKTNGIGYVLYFVDVNTSKELLRVHTINMSYTPDDAAWGKLTAAATTPNAPGWQVKIVAAFFVDNAVPDGINPVTSPQPRLVYFDLTM